MSEANSQGVSPAGLGGAALRPICSRMLAGTPWGLGTAPLGDLAVGVQQARTTVHVAIAAGWRLIDTAPYYGRGEAERLLRHALRGVPREAYLLSTKVGRLLIGEEDGVSAEYDFSATGVRRSLNESLERLGQDRVDIALIHDPDEHVEQAKDEAYGSLAELRASGVVRAIGVGVNDAALAADFVSTTDVDCVLIAGRYTLLDQSAAEELLPLCAERGVEVVLGGVFNSGILAAPSRRPTYDYAPAPKELLERALAIQNVCRRHKVPIAAAALAFASAHPAVSTVLMGCQDADEARSNARMVSWPVPPDVWGNLLEERLLPDDAVLPTDGRE